MTEGRVQSCPKCGHKPHGEVCLNMASDNDCACKAGRGLPRSTGPIAASIADQCGAYPPKPYLQQMCMVERGHADAHQNYGGHTWEDEPVRGRVLPDSECSSCGEDMPPMECPKAQRPCGHHCNCSWIHDCCHWCGVEFGEEGMESAPARVQSP